jgi:DNA-binding XRE family transcriptional regulator
MSESVSIIPNIIIFAIVLVILLALVIYLLVLVIRALRKYLKSTTVREEKKEYKKSLGEVLKSHRTSCHMTQEFVAESIGVTRQAVSKWENGTADPSTSNLLALSKLYGVSAEELLRQVKSEKTED